ncbi:hypothetical protein Taro_005254 [Colocasia esculenta]|uniref:alpha,alpha-trehalose-phosphate synthase (UDP-forming) n=1 Tax=Colocasia esculenta TaxID=4460 RepID=A0A843TKH3_COLES|nr:hypothetical protein [Colocasia esculenta]
MKLASQQATRTQTEHVAANKYGGRNPTSRVERLLRERELRKFNRAINLSDEAGEYVREGGILEHERSAGGGGEMVGTREGEILDAAAVAVRAANEAHEGQDGRSVKQRLLVVANRLPVSAVRRGEESWSLEISAGGLVSALLGVKEFEARWIGWAGVNVPDEIGRRALAKALAEKRCIPVFLDEEIVHQYYNGYCNNILWPLFHYLGLPQEDRLATTRSFQSQFDAYKRANQMFADVVNEHYEEGDVVWCHDYHLMFLPKCLKEYNSKMKVGWFLHTPFPSSEIHRTLPSRSELLRSVLAADLVGFHTYDYARHFVSACTRILGFEGTPEGVEDQGKLTRVAAFPIGIDSDRFTRAVELPQVQSHIKDLKERFAGRKVCIALIIFTYFTYYLHSAYHYALELSYDDDLTAAFTRSHPPLLVGTALTAVMLGVDRLDMIKGIPQKILAFEKFLEENPTWRDKVVLLQIAVPTRTDVSEYQKLTSQVHEIVGRINGRFGTLTAVPIHHLDRSLDFHALCALYAVTDVAIVTSLRDGMNLVSYEFVACQEEKKGVLILSEFAGAAQSLGAGALLVNPWNVTEVANSIGYALNMPADEREKRHRHNFAHVTTHTAQDWAETFVSELNDTIVEAQLRTRQVPPLLPTKNAVERYLQSKNRLLILLSSSPSVFEQFDFFSPSPCIEQFQYVARKIIKDLNNLASGACRKQMKFSYTENFTFMPPILKFLEFILSCSSVVENQNRALNTSIVSFAGDNFKVVFSLIPCLMFKCPKNANRPDYTWGLSLGWLLRLISCYVLQTSLIGNFSVAFILFKLLRGACQFCLPKLQGFNATLTEPVESPGRRGGDQIKEMELKLHPELKEALTILCSEQKTTVVVLSGSDRSVLDDNFGEYNMWLAAENGMFLRLTKGEWMTTMPEHLNMDWVESVKHVFEYFTERTPRSHFEHRETSLVWNYKYADVEFGRLQARDMLQHLWTGPISNAAVDVIQGSRSVEVRSVGVTKGAAIDRILGEIVHSKCMVTPIDYVLCIGHFLGKDEDIYTFFEPELPAEPMNSTRSKATEIIKPPNERKTSTKLSNVKNNLRAAHGRAQKVSTGSDRKMMSNNFSGSRLPQEKVAWHEGSSVLDLKGENYFSCAVGRKRSNARYLLDSADDVVTFLKELAEAAR